MAAKPGLGTAQGYVKDLWRDERCGFESDRKPLPGLRRMLRLFGELAALLDRGRRNTGSNPSGIRQRARLGHVLRRRSLRGAEGQNRRSNVVLDLRRAAGGLPGLHAGRCRMCDGAQEMGAARPAFRTGVKKAYAVTASTSSSSSSSSSSSWIGAKVDSGLVESVIGLRPL